MSNLSYFLSVILLVASSNAINYRLPTNVFPTYYTIRLAPKIEEGTFVGKAIINIIVFSNDTKTVTLHAKDFNVHEIFALNGNRNRVEPKNHTIDNRTDFWTLDFSETPLTAGEWSLHFLYSGQLENEPKGFYRSSYTSETGQKKWLAATQFAPIHARRAFPCFDEPAMKAEFEIAIVHPVNYSVISNMPVAYKKNYDGVPSLDYEAIQTNFNVTPVMSTYVIAFMISDLKNATIGNRPFSVWSRDSQIQNSNYALSIGQSELELLEDYTVFEHVIPKMDNVAIPRLQTGSMDNWGLVTYGENELVYEEDVTSTSNKQNIAMTIARKFAHQWFGNLVSPMWWDFTWLNEGFADYFQYYITDEAEADWRMMEQFVVKNLQEKAFFADDTKTQHPLNAKVNSPAEIDNNFDDITSSKAASIIRMFSHALGPKVFRAGLKSYLKKQAYSVATSNDLLNALANAKGAPENVKTYLDSWVNQKGYPLLTVHRPRGGNWWVSQTRYLPKNRGTEDATEVWSIPISWTAQDSPNFDTTPQMWLSNSESRWIGASFNTWIILNNQQMGYYRVNYDDTTWDRITNYLNTNRYTKIHVLNRAQLLDDSFHLAQSGYLSNHYKFLNISRHLQQEVDYIPWYPAFRAFSYLNKALMHTEHYYLFKLYMLRLIEKLEMTVGYSEMPHDEHVTKLNRINVVEWACKMGSSMCTTAVQEMFLQYLNGSRQISTDLRSVVLCAGIRMANATIWNKTFRLYEESKDIKQRGAILDALGCSSDPKILKSYLMKAMNPASEISLGFVIKAITEGSESGADVAIDFIKKNFATIIENGGDKESVLRWSNYIGSRMFTENQMEKLEKFSNSLRAKNKDLADALTADAVASAMSNVEWVEKYQGAISSFLRDQHLLNINNVMWQ